MARSLVHYDDPPPSKLLPARGTLAASRPEALATHCFRWALINLILFLLPTFVGLAGIHIFGSRLGVYTHTSPEELAYCLAYFWITSGSALISVAAILFPRFLRYHLVIPLILGRRRHRSHFSFMSQRRLNRVCDKSVFTIFIQGLGGRSLPILVTKHTTVYEIYQYLADLGLVPKGARRSMYFTVGGRKVSWDATLESLNLGPMSHLTLRMRVPGGAKGGANDQPEASSSSLPAKRKRNVSRMRDVLEAEGQDSDGNPEGDRPPKKNSKKRVSKPKPDDRSDPDDDDFPDLADASSGSSSDSDSEVEVLVPNDELAASLPTKTLGTSSRRQEKTRQSATKSKSSKGKGKRKEKAVYVPAYEPPIVPEDSTVPSASTGSSKKSTRNPIYFFFEVVDHDTDGSKEEDTRYYKCYHGNRKIYKITKRMNHNTSKMQAHLQKNFLPHFRLYQVLHNRESPPTNDELELARGTKLMDAGTAAEYTKQADTLSKNIKTMFLQQAADAEEPWNQDHFEELVPKWVAACDQPFTAVNAPEFREMLQYAHRKPLNIPRNQSVKDRIAKMSREMREALAEIFKENRSDFVLSLDAWTSSNGYAFMAIVIHYIGNDGKLEECLIDFRELIGQHSGENMAAVVWETVKGFGLIGRITAFVMDNATNNDTMVEAFERRCDELGIPFSCSDSRMRCMPHTIHLLALKLLEAIGVLTKEESKKSEAREGVYQEAATESLSGERENEAAGSDEAPESEGPKPTGGVGLAIFKLRKIIRHVRSSPQRRKIWQKEVSDWYKELREASAASPTPISVPGLDIDKEMTLMLILDVKTRWSSSHQMLRRALRFRRPIFTYVAKDEELRAHELSAADWDALKTVADWLMVYRHATTGMSATKQPMLSSTHAIFIGLQAHLKESLAKLPESAAPELRSGLVEAHLKLSDYFTKFDESRYYSWVTLLDPRLSYTGLKLDYADNPELLIDLDIAKRKLQTHFDAVYAKVVPEAEPTPLGSPQKFDFTSRYTNRASAATENELTEYFRLTTVPEPWSVDPLQWWYSRRKQFPNLYLLVRNVLCIPGSAVAVERIFSGGRDTIGLRRASLKADTIQTLMFVKARLRVARAALKKEAGDDEF